MRENHSECSYLKLHKHIHAHAQTCTVLMISTCSRLSTSTSTSSAATTLWNCPLSTRACRHQYARTSPHSPHPVDAQSTYTSTLLWLVLCSERCCTAIMHTQMRLCSDCSLCTLISIQRPMMIQRKAATSTVPKTHEQDAKRAHQLPVSTKAETPKIMPGSSSCSSSPEGDRHRTVPCTHVAP